jgi:hypothetical protein
MIKKDNLGYMMRRSLTISAIFQSADCKKSLQSARTGTVPSANSAAKDCPDLTAARRITG